MPTGFIASHRKHEPFPESVLAEYEKLCALTPETSAPFLANLWSCELIFDDEYQSDIISLNPDPQHLGTYFGHGGHDSEDRPPYSTALAKANKHGALALLRMFAFSQNYISNYFSLFAYALFRSPDWPPSRVWTALCWTVDEGITLEGYCLEIAGSALRSGKFRAKASNPPKTAPKK